MQIKKKSDTITQSSSLRFSCNIMKYPLICRIHLNKIMSDVIEESMPRDHDRNEEIGGGNIGGEGIGGEEIGEENLSRTDFNFGPL